MYYNKSKIQLISKYTVIKNTIYSPDIFEDEVYVRNEESVISEIKTLMMFIYTDIEILYDEYKDYAEITNVNKGVDTVSFSLSITNENYMKNDFFISYLVYMNLFEILKHIEYYGMDLVEMDNKYDILLDNFKIGYDRGCFRFKYGKAIGSYFIINNKEDNNSPHIRFESVKEGEYTEEYVNTYYINNVSYDFYNDFIEKFKMIEPK